MMGDGTRDELVVAVSRAMGITVVVADASAAASALVRRHGSGRTASLLLGQGLAGVALLSAELGADDDRVSMALQVDGPIGGMQVEANGKGQLRGYTNEKILSAHDGKAAPDLLQTLGRCGRVAVTYSGPSRDQETSMVDVNPPDVRTAMARYYNAELGRPAAVELHASAQDGFGARCCGAVAWRSSDGRPENFIPVLERFDEGSVTRALGEAAGRLDLVEMFGVSDLVVERRRALRFGCSCSIARVEQAFDSVPTAELRGMADRREAQEVTCHYCGKKYVVKPKRVRDILRRRG